jgi:hypothetical protein
MILAFRRTNMKISTPVLHVNPSRTYVVDDQQQRWGSPQAFRNIGLQIPVTKRFSILLSDKHVPYGIEVSLSRTNGTVRSDLAFSRLEPIWIRFLQFNLIVSGTYNLAVVGGFVEPESLPKVFRVPVRLTSSGYIELIAASASEAADMVHGKNLSGNFVVMGSTPTVLSVYGSIDEVNTIRPGLRIGATYYCRSTSRPQINKKEVTLVEIRTARQVKVMNEHGDEYLTSPDNLTYLRG